VLDKAALTGGKLRYPSDTHRIVMSDFDYRAPAELFAAQGRSGLRYRRFPNAAQAIQYAVEKLPATVLSATSIEVDDERYDAKQIRALYDSQSYPFERHVSL
jgi:hypothetical protein